MHISNYYPDYIILNLNNLREFFTSAMNQARPDIFVSISSGWVRSQFLCRHIPRSLEYKTSVWTSPLFVHLTPCMSIWAYKASRLEVVFIEIHSSFSNYSIICNLKKLCPASLLPERLLSKLWWVLFYL